MDNTASASASAPAPATNAPLDQTAIDNKVTADLNTLIEKMDACDGMIRGTGGPIPRDPAILQTIGFVEACAPRMVELVEAAAQGVVSEHVLMKCLEVNDRLTKQLADIDAVRFAEGPAAAGGDPIPAAPPASAPPPPPAAEGDQPTRDPLDDLLLLGEEDGDVAGTAMPTATQDPFGNPVKSTSPAAGDGNAAPAVTKSKSEDEFDEFLSERTGS